MKFALSSKGLFHVAADIVHLALQHCHTSSFMLLKSKYTY